jgi:aminopeptidase N
MASDNLTETQASERAGQIEVATYELHLDLTDDPTAATFSSTCRIRFSSRQGPATFVNLNVGESGRLRSVSVDDSACAAALDTYDGTRILLPELAAGRHSLDIVADCSYQRVGVGLHRAIDPVDGEVYVYTHMEPFDAHKVFACFDQPDLKASLAITVTAPNRWELCSNGRVLGVDHHGDGTRTWRFNVTPPLPPYLMAIAGGVFHVIESQHDGVRLGLYARESLARYLDEQAEELFGITRQGLDFFAKEFGFPYPFDEYNQLFVPEFNVGAMENPGCVTFNETYIFRSRATGMQRARRGETIVHEMAHVHGFGDVTTMRWWGDLWLNETFATYMANKALVEATEFHNAWVDFANTVKSVAARQDQLRSTHPISTPCADTDEVRQNFDGITYHKGAAVLKQLVAWVGAAPFKAGVQEYFRRYRWGNAGLREFLGCIEEASGRDLGAWAAEWLQTAGMNTLRPEVRVVGGRIDSFAILQSAAPEHPTLRSHHVQVGLYRPNAGGLVRYRRLGVDVRGERTEVPALAGADAADLIVVNDDDLTFAKLRFDEHSLTTVLERAGEITDPLSRSLAWAALWDMTRDGELATRDFVATVARHSRAETEVTVLERLLSQALAAIDQFGDPAERGPERARLAGAAWESLLVAEPGSDVQLTWMRTHICAAEHDADLDRLERLLDGAETVAGLSIDTDLRWLVVSRLAARGRDAGARIAAQLAADNTDIGRRRAAACRSAQPDAAAKSAAWSQLLEDTKLPLQMQQAILAGFGVGPFGAGGIIQWDPAQDELMRPYVSRWIEALPAFWAQRGPEEAEIFTEVLYPRQLVEPATINAADSALAAIQAAHLPESTRRAASRLIVEGKDGTERALRARARDIAARPAPAW